MSLNICNYYVTVKKSLKTLLNPVFSNNRVQKNHLDLKPKGFRLSTSGLRSKNKYAFLEGLEATLKQAAGGGVGRAGCVCCCRNKALLLYMRVFSRKFPI